MDYYYLSVKASYYSPSYGLTIHNDHQSKVCAILIYAGWSDNIIRNEGGTQFYEVAKGKKTPKNHAYMNHPDFLIRSNIQPYKNNLVAFMRSSISNHGVIPTTEDSKINISRGCFQVNLMSKNHSSRIVRKLAWCRRLLFGQCSYQELFDKYSEISIIVKNWFSISPHN